MWELLEPFISPISLRIMLVAVIAGVASSLVGCYLVLRGMSLMGDAIAHAVLPGIVLAFLFSGSLNIFPLFIGAVAIALLTTFLTETIHRWGRVPPDASMGVVFTSLFALGIVLVKRYLNGVHFDVACVYEGSLAYVGLFTVDVAGWQIPRAAMTLAPVLIINIVAIAVFWKEFKVSAFDPALATAMGFSAGVMHYFLMSLVAITAIASFEAVGSILVVAMLVAPAAAAQLMCKRLLSMLVVAAMISVVAAISGYAAAFYWDVSPAGMITTVLGVVYASAFLFAPQHGMASTVIRNLNTSMRIVREDLLSMLYRIEELKSDRVLTGNEAIEGVGGGVSAWLALRSLKTRKLVTQSAEALRLTDNGRKRAQNLVRSHRLWENFLVEHLGLPLDHVHEPAHRVEHFLDAGIREEIEASIDNRRQDPHGRDIPE